MSGLTLRTSSTSMFSLLACRWQIVGEEDVAAADQFLENRTGVVVVERETDAALAAVGRLHDRRERRPGSGGPRPSTLTRPRCASPVTGMLDLDHLGAPVREDRTGRRNERELRDLQDPDSVRVLSVPRPPAIINDGRLIMRRNEIKYH